MLQLVLGNNRCFSKQILLRPFVENIKGLTRVNAKRYGYLKKKKQMYEPNAVAHIATSMRHGNERQHLNTFQT